MKTKGDRYNTGKPQWGLVPFSALEPMVKVLEFGAEKYAAYNWMKGLPIQEICESLLRHVHAFLEGEDNCPESGLSHIGHMQCNTLFLAWMMKHRPEMDDRFDYETFLSFIEDETEDKVHWTTKENDSDIC